MTSDLPAPMYREWVVSTLGKLEWNQPDKSHCHVRENITFLDFLAHQGVDRPLGGGGRLKEKRKVLR